MAAAVAIVSLVDERSSWVAGNKYFAIGEIQISASPATYVTGGIVMNLFIPLLKATMAPVMLLVQGQGSGTTGTLFVYVYVPGSNGAVGTLKIFTANTTGDGLAELAEGDIPADVSTDTITFLGIFNGMQ